MADRSRMFHIDGKSMVTWNCWVGCDFQCSYCSARKLAFTRLKNSPRYIDGFSPHQVTDKLNRKFKPDTWVFIGYMGDISFAPRAFIVDLCARISSQPEVKFLFCTKNPTKYITWHITWPDNLYLGATIETNRDYKLSRAPIPLFRYRSMQSLVHPKKFISIEPIMDFDLGEFLTWIERIKPEIVEVGADNYRNKLPEPKAYKVQSLLNGLRNICPNVIEKVGLSRLKDAI